MICFHLIYYNKGKFPCKVPYVNPMEWGGGEGEQTGEYMFLGGGYQETLSLIEVEYTVYVWETCRFSDIVR